MHRISILFLAVALSSCARTTPSFIGIWHCDAGRSGVYVWNVEPDRITAEFQDEQAELGYTLRRSHDPHWLDIMRSDEVHQCILEFVDPDTIRVTGFGGDGSRPSEFTTDQNTLTFKRNRQRNCPTR